MLFDLDGTLLDTAPDMTAALNQLLSEEQRDPVAYQKLRPVVSHGSRGLIEAGFGRGLNPETMARLTKRFLEIYAARLAIDTTPFEGVTEVLASLEARNIPWGIVTNKPGWLTDPLLQQLDFGGGALCVISGDTLPQRKPDPTPLYHAARALETPAADCVYIGDAERDIEAGRAAGMTTVVALYGYIPDDEHPGSWQADGQVEHAKQLLEWFGA